MTPGDRVLALGRIRDAAREHMPEILAEVLELDSDELELVRDAMRASYVAEVTPVAVTAWERAPWA